VGIVSLKALFVLICVSIFPINAFSQGYVASFTARNSSATLSPTNPVGVIEIPVVLDRPVAEPFVLVDVAYVPGSAIEGTHYQTPMNQVIIPMGESSGTLIIPVKGGSDSSISGNKDFGVVITGGNGVSPGEQATHKTTLKYPQLQLMGVVTQILASNEGDEGDTKKYEFIYSLSQISEAAITVELAKVGGAASSLDFNLLNPVIVIPPGSLSAKFNVMVIGDEEREETETADFIARASASDGTFVKVDNPDSKLTIIDDDTRRLSMNNGRVLEDSGKNSLTIKLSKKHDKDFTVTISLIGGSALIGDDFTFGNPFVVTIPKGSTSARFEYQIIDDQDIEGDEDVIFLMEASDNDIEVVTENPSVTIVDNDTRELTFTVNTSITDPDSEIKALSFQATADIKRDGRYKYKTRETNASVFASPDLLGLSGIAKFKVKTLEFNRSWEVTNLEIIFSDFPVSPFPIPGPHIWMQVFIAGHGPYGDLVTRAPGGGYLWKPQLRDIRIIDETGDSIELELSQNINLPDFGTETLRLSLRLRK